MNYCYLTVSDVRDAGLGRRCAMRKLIFDGGRLEEEFIEYIGGDITKVKPDELCTKIDEFANQRGFKIMSEVPHVKFDEEDQEYYIVMSYKISMG